MGSRIGADALLEPGSVLPPFSRVGAGEIWGGNPATFRRLRDDVTGGAEDGEAEAWEPLRSREGSDSGARQLVSEALNLPLEQVTAELASHSCPRWDSLGRMAIAAALMDRTGRPLGPREVLRLTSVSRVEELLRGKAGEEHHQP
jgi:hypothetical protein